jgi:hypothetical protein
MDDHGDLDAILNDPGAMVTSSEPPPDGPDPELVTGLAILLHQANLAALRGGLGAEAQAARMALCKLLGIRETAMPLTGIESRLRAALTSSRSTI